jgi:hypothetical protein
LDPLRVRHFSAFFVEFPRDFHGRDQDAGAALGGNHWPARAFGGRDGPMANSSIEYRRHAENCLRLAEHAGSPDARSLLRMMASAWHRLAQDVENIERPAEGGDTSHASDERQTD